MRRTPQERKEREGRREAGRERKREGESHGKEESSPQNRIMTINNLSLLAFLNLYILKGFQR